jgi:two-component system response regulator LytT
MNDLLHILVCDDEPACVKELGILLKQYEKANKDIFEIISVTDFEQRDDFNADIIFLDIEMPKKDGIKIKNELESLNCKSLIIFVTNHTESIYDAFGTNVIGFCLSQLIMLHLKFLWIKQDVLYLEGSCSKSNLVFGLA